MTTIILPYASHHYNTLPGIDDAGRSITSDDLGLLTTIVGQVFIKYGVQNVFGIGLLHNHFPLEEKEILVNIGSVAVPWNTESQAEQLGHVRGSAWRFTKDGIAPYEFIYDVTQQAELENFPTFVHELRTVLENLGLSEKLGLCTFSKEDSNSEATQVEFTQGRANITLPFDLDPQSGPNKSIEAVWQFSLSPGTGVNNVSDGTVPQPVVLKKCKSSCKTGSDNSHKEQHLTGSRV